MATYLSISRIDPFAASSLLQKAIRRGDVDMSQAAARTLYRQRGKAVWRRLLTIAFEDVGLAGLDIVKLVSEAVQSQLRSPSQQPWAVLDDLCGHLAGAIKSRSADHLYSAATQFRIQSCVKAPKEVDIGEYILAVADPNAELIRRAAAMLDGVKSGASSPDLKRLELLKCVLSARSIEWIDLCLIGYGIVRHPFIAVLPLIQSAFDEGDRQFAVRTETLPEFALVNGLPTYAYDKHTALGKKAISLLVQRDGELLRALQNNVMPSAHIDVAGMAAFHAEAVAIKPRLVWAQALELEKAGFLADMLKSGCPAAGAEIVFGVVQDKLPQLNQIRAELLRVRT